MRILSELRMEYRPSRLASIFPIPLALLTGVFLAFCLVFEEPTIWLWSPYENPPWWQSDLLGEIGFYMKVPTLWFLQGISHLAGLPANYHPPEWIWTLLLCAPFLTIAAITFAVFYLAKLATT